MARACPPAPLLAAEMAEYDSAFRCYLIAAVAYSSCNGNGIGGDMSCSCYFMLSLLLLLVLVLLLLLLLLLLLSFNNVSL